MIKRVKATKIGDVFEVKISDTEKRYMQYVVSDMNCLNSDVIRVFKRKYSTDNNPKIEEIVKDEVLFFKHCDTKHGIRLGIWNLYGNSNDVGNVNEIFFRDTRDQGDIVSSEWFIWRVNGEFKKIGKLNEETKKIDIGLIYRAEAILYMIKYDGSFYGIYPH